MTRRLRILVILALLPGAAWAQSTGSVETAPPTTPPYGGGELPPLQYAGPSSPKNFVSLDLNAETAYDDNVFTNNALRLGDAVFSIAPHLLWSETRKALSFSLDYLPDVEIYGQIQGRNQLNHALQFDLNYRVNPHLGLRVRDSSYYRNDVFMPRLSGGLLSRQGAPTSLNDSVFAPLARVFGNNSRVDVVYEKTRRTWFTLFGDVLQREFLHESSGAGTLLNTHGWSSGSQFIHRFTAKTTFGTVYMLQELRFGPSSRTLAHSGFVSLSHQFSPSLGLQVFGGPQYMRVHDRFLTAFAIPGGIALARIPIFRTGWHEAFGGSFLRQTEKNALEISAHRLLTDGGGLLPAVSNSFVRGEARERIARRWNAIFELEVAGSHAFSFLSEDARVRTQRVGVAFERSLKEGLTARLGYNFLRQKAEGSFPFQNDVDRNRVSFGVYYRLGQKTLGR